MKVIIAFLSLICFKMNAQNAKEMFINFGESIQLSGVQETTNFAVSGEGTTVHLKGVEINSFVFSKPGKYNISVTTKEYFTGGDCNHTSLPKKIVVTVGRSKMYFDASKIQFSTPIQKNKDLEGTILTIPVFVETFDDSPIVLNNEVVNVAGIGSSVTAKLNSTALELPVGNHVLTYLLCGKVTENAYLMFDFINAEGNVQSVAMLNPIQN